MRNARRLLLLILPLILAVPPGWSDESQISGKSVVVFPLAPLAGAQKDRQASLSEAVEQEFGAVGFTLIPQDQWIGEAGRLKIPPLRILEAQQALAIARSTTADMAVIGSYSMENDRILVSVQCYDVAAGTLITGFLRTMRFNLGFYNLLHREIGDLVQKVIFVTAPKLIGIQENLRVDAITFTCPQDGLEVVVEGQKSAGRIQDGSLVFKTGGVKAGTVLRLEKQQEGYHTVWQTVHAAPEVVLTPIPKKDTWATEIDWTTGQLEGAGATMRWYPLPNWIMVCFSEYLFAQIPFVHGASWPLHSDSELLAGLYLFWPPESAFRFGISAGFGTYLTWVPATSLPVYTDVYINLLNIWAEYRIWNVTFLLRIQGKVALGLGTNVLGTNFISGGPLFIPVTLGVVLPWR
ncbi:MAG: hypothetical protein ABSB63_06175 [Spirochaetia bacterium]|jgi:hypothetical protein